MKFTPKKSIKRFQQGGPVEPAAEEMPMEGAEEMLAAEPAPQQQQENPLIMLAQAAMQGLQQQDCQIMAQVCQGLVQLVQQAQGAAAPEGEPVFRKGGVLYRRVRK